MSTLQKYISDVRELVHDLSGNSWTDAELIVHINSARQRVALDTHCIRQYITGMQTPPQVETYPFSGGVAGIAVTNGGSGYTSAPAVVIPAGATGQAQASATINAAGNVTAVNMISWGSGYAGPPLITFSGGGGINAAATAVVPLNVIDILSVLIIFGINRYALMNFPWSPFNAFCRTNTSTFSRPGAFCRFLESSTLYLANVPDQNYTMEWDTVQNATDMQNPTAVDAQIFPPYDDSVKFYAAHTALLKMQNFAQAEYMNRKYETRIGQIIRTRQDRVDPDVYRTWWRRMRRA